MKHLPLRECGYAIAFIVALLLLYGGAYLAMMERRLLLISSVASQVYVDYRYGDEWSEALFGPAHELDRQIRPELWKGEVDHTANYLRQAKAILSTMEKERQSVREATP
jgi:hypothetical protein